MADDCVVSQEIGYQFYATIFAFYLPLAVMIVIYYRIYMVSSRIAEAEARSKPHDSNYRKAEGNISLMQIPANKNTSEGGIINIEMSNDIINNPVAYDGENKGVINSSQPSPNANGNNDRSDLQLLPPDQILPKGSVGGDATTIVGKKQSVKRKRISSLSNECKATKTLGIIMGAFTACWLPFFILALVKPLCSNSGAPDEFSCIPHWLNSLFQWLGYANSFLNPIIYARFNRDFRTPFKEILLLRCRGINLRLRTESYAEQYGIKAVGVATKRRINICNTVVGYQSHGQTVVNLTNVKDNGNGNAATLCDNSAGVLQ